MRLHKFDVYLRIRLVRFVQEHLAMIEKHRVAFVLLAKQLCERSQVDMQKIETKLTCTL